MINRLKKFESMKCVKVLLCIAVLLITMLPMPAVTKAEDSEHRPIMVSLGDSYSSGEGAEPYYGQSIYLSDQVENQDWLAHRSMFSWPSMLTLPSKENNAEYKMADNRDSLWYFAASSGAMTVHMEKSQRKDYFKDSDPFPYSGYEYLEPQLNIFDELGDDKADYVTLTLGGNDAGFSDVVRAGVMGSIFLTPSHVADMINHTWEKFYKDNYKYCDEDCYDKKDCEEGNCSFNCEENCDAYCEEYCKDGIRNNLRKAYEAIAEKAGPQAQIIVAGYPQLLDPDGSLVFFSPEVSSLINTAVSSFNNAIENLVNECRASGMKICFVSVEDAFKGHAAYSDEPYINKVKMWSRLQDLEDYQLTSASSMHPNYIKDKGDDQLDGVTAYAECVQKKINDLENGIDDSPQPVNTTPNERDIVLVLDVSGSMDGTPLDETKKASTNFISTILKEDASIGIVTYDYTASMVSDFSVNESSLIRAVNDIDSGGSTNIEAGLQMAEGMLSTSNAEKKIIVLMSDGLPNEGKVDEELIEYADSIKDKDIYIYTLGFFESVDEKSSAQYLMEKMASDGCHYEVDDADNLVFFFDDIAGQINGQKYIYVRIACPVDVTVKYNSETLCSVDRKLNTRTKFGSLTFEENEEEAEDGSDNRIKVLRLKEGVDYDIQIKGNGRGRMNYTIGFMDESGEYTDMRKFKNIKISRKTVIDTVATHSDSTILNVDEDGDGKYDLKYKAGVNGVGEIVDYTYLVYIGVGAGVLVALIIIVVIVKRRRKKKSFNLTSTP